MLVAFEFLIFCLLALLCIGVRHTGGFPSDIIDFFVACTYWLAAGWLNGIIWEKSPDQ